MNSLIFFSFVFVFFFSNSFFPAVNCRTDTGGEVANQAMHVPFYIPKVPGRLYYYFGKPIETNGKRSLGESAV